MAEDKLLGEFRFKEFIGMGWKREKHGVISFVAARLTDCASGKDVEGRAFDHDLDAPKMRFLLGYKKSQEVLGEKKSRQSMRRWTRRTGVAISGFLSTAWK